MEKQVAYLNKAEEAGIHISWWNTHGNYVFCNVRHVKFQTIILGTKTEPIHSFH
jgi:hypothetical protein